MENAITLEELYDRKRDIIAELNFIEDQIIGADQFEEYERLEAEEKEMSDLVDRVNSEVFTPMKMEIKDVGSFLRIYTQDHVEDTKKVNGVIDVTTYTIGDQDFDKKDILERMLEPEFKEDLKCVMDTYTQCKMIGRILEFNLQVNIFEGTACQIRISPHRYTGNIVVPELILSVRQVGLHRAGLSIKTIFSRILKFNEVEDEVVGWLNENPIYRNVSLPSLSNKNDVEKLFVVGDIYKNYGGVVDISEISDVLNKTLDIIDVKYKGDYSIDKYFQDLRNVNI